MKTYPLILFTVVVLLPLAHGAGGAFITAWLDSVGIKYVPPVTPTTTPTPNSDPKCTDCSKTDQGRLFWGIFGKDPPLPCCTVDCTCGIEGNAVLRIVGGAATVNGQYPWIVALDIESTTGSMASQRVACAGTLVAANWVLTSAHCVTVPTAHTKDTMSIVLGEHDVSSSNDAADTNRKSVMLALDPIVHESYKSPNADSNDIALLKLAESVDLTTYTPACLPSSDDDFTGQMGKVVGWGATSKNVCPPPLTAATTVLLEVDVPIVSDNVCKAASSTTATFFDFVALQCVTEAVSYNNLISEDMVCAGETDKGFCMHDEGGPLTVKSSSTNQHDLVGITSWNKGCAADGLYGVYAEVAELRNWIDEKIAANGGATYCSS